MLNKKVIGAWTRSNRQRYVRPIFPVICFVLLSNPLFAHSRASDKLLAEARAKEIAGDFDAGLQLAQQALATDPSDPSYALQVRRLRFESGTRHIRSGYVLRTAGDFEHALAEFEKARTIDPASDLAVQEISRTRDIITRNNGAQHVSVSDSGKEAMTPADLALFESNARSEKLAPLPVLKPMNGDPIDIRMNNRPRILFETLGKIAGINVLFDPDYDAQQTIRMQALDLTHTTLEQALNQLSITTRSYWKPLSSNTIFITLDTPAKHRDYAEQVVRIFYLTNMTSPQEMQEVLTVLRTVTDVQKVFSFTAQNALIVRAEADTMALVEKLIAGLDKPRSEVVVDVMVMEVASSWTRALQAAVAGKGLNTSAVFAPRPGITTPVNASSTSSTTSTSTSTSSSTTTSSTSVPIANLGHISSADFSVTTLPGATLEAVMSDSATRILQQPQLRAVDNAKAVLKIGDKVPTASGSYSAGVTSTTGSVSPLVNTQFTFIDVGVNLELTPKVHSTDEVSLHLDLDVSQVKSEIDLGGINEPEISQNKMTSDVRLREGEVSLIGGIIQQTDSKTQSGIPGLSGIPVIGRLFSGENLEKDRTELVIALVPHIVRAPSIDKSDLAEVAAGNATEIKVNYLPTISRDPDLMNAKSDPVISTPGAPPATAPPDAHLTVAPQTAEARLGTQFTISLAAENAALISSFSLHLEFDPALLRVTNVVPSGGLQLTQDIRNDRGWLHINAKDTKGKDLSTGFVSISFQAIGRGETSIAITPENSFSSPQPVRITVQ